MALDNRRLAVVVSQTANAKAAPLALEDIPEWVRQDAEDAYEVCGKNPLARLHAEFDTVEDAKLYQRLMTSYCQIRTVDGKPAQIRFRKSPTRNQPDHVMDFRVTDLLTENEKKTADIREAAAKANAAAPARVAAATSAPTPATAAIPAKRPGRPAKAR